MRSERRGLTVLSLVIILVVVGVIAFFLLRSRGPADPSASAATPATPPADAAPTTASAGGVLTAVREPAPSLAAGTADTISVRLANGAGTPMIGVPVVFTVESGGGSVTPSPVRTDSTGLAMSVWRLGGEPGANSIRVTADAPSTLVDPLVLTVTTFSP